jgi:DNA polymerase-3 subunit epsilon
MREIVFDTETTGFDPLSGHRMAEIGCVEIVNGIPTGKHFHRYINPERDMPPAAEAVHGLSVEFLSDKPVFGEIVGDLLEFIAADPLIAHNAGFDISFLDAELTRLGFPVIEPSRVICSLIMARKAFPGQPCSLDALCKRFAIDLSERTHHGALLDARLLADVYLELQGGRQRGLSMQFAVRGGTTNGKRETRKARPHDVPADELAAHEAAVEKLKNPLWKATG